jgi:hypothetical protein
MSTLFIEWYYYEYSGKGKLKGTKSKDGRPMLDDQWPKPEKSPLCDGLRVRERGCVGLWAAGVCLEKTEVINSGFQLLYPDKN